MKKGMCKKPQKYALGTSNVRDPNNPLLPSVEPYQPSRLDAGDSLEGGVTPGASIYGGIRETVQTGPGSTEYEDNLRAQMESRQRLQEEINPPKKRGVSSGLFHLKSGMSKVPGKGDGTKDTVPAVLAPGEAVLNKAAAELLGRGLIKKLNMMGAMHMGMMEPDADDMPEHGEPDEDDMPKKHKCGTSKVHGKK